MLLKKHELTQKQKYGRLKFEWNILIMTSTKQFLLLRLYLELEKLNKENEEKYEKSMELKVNAWVSISKNGEKKTIIQLFTENIIK